MHQLINIFSQILFIYFSILIFFLFQFISVTIVGFPFFNRTI